MNEASGVARKRTFGSPQKTQSSIITFSKKKQNQSQTPECTALTRSFKAITTMNTVSSPPAKSRLNNNPFTPLAEEEENEEEIEEVDNTTPGIQHSTTSTAETDSTYDSTTDPSIVSSPEKKLLSKKALQALQKIRTARIALSDTSLREELDGLLDKGIMIISRKNLGGKLLIMLKSQEIKMKGQRNTKKKKKKLIKTTMLIPQKWKLKSKMAHKRHLPKQVKRVGRQIVCKLQKKVRVAERMYHSQMLRWKAQQTRNHSDKGVLGTHMQNQRHSYMR
jgi:hypothetical protein